MTTTTINRSSRMYRLGKDVSKAQSAREALQLADMDWEPIVVPGEHLALAKPDKSAENGHGPWASFTAPGMDFLVRPDTKTVLGVHGGRYQEVANRQAFAVADVLRAQGGVFARAAEINHGRRAYLTMDLPALNFNVTGEDEIRFGVRFLATHDGSGKLKGSIEAERLVCANGLTVPIKGTKIEYAIAHTASAELRIEEAKEIMLGAARYSRAFAAVSQHLIDTPMSEPEFGSFVDGVFPEPDIRESRRAHARWAERRAELKKLFRLADTNDSGRGTKWAAFNAVTEYVDWGTNVQQGTAESVEQARAIRQIESTDRQTTKDFAFKLVLAA
jgi:phage/plasmid-like protein (TIGR03299 family)